MTTKLDYRRCPKSGLECIVCARSCVIEDSEAARKDFEELFAKLDAREERSDPDNFDYDPDYAVQDAEDRERAYPQRKP